MNPYSYIYGFGGLFPLFAIVNNAAVHLSAHIFTICFNSMGYILQQWNCGIIWQNTTFYASVLKLLLGSPIPTRWDHPLMNWEPELPRAPLVGDPSQEEGEAGSTRPLCPSSPCRD